MISFDTETTGLDFRHGCRPFFVTACEGDGTIHFWEWSVDPLTRMPEIPEEDLREIGDLLFASGPHGPIGDIENDPDAGLILHNSKFDIRAMDSIGFWDRWDVYEVWKQVIDTQMATHCLYSNKKQDLTSCAMHYLGADILPLETALEHAVKEARRLVGSKKFVEAYGRWNTCGEDHPMTPSTSGSADNAFWRCDYWLPRAVAKHLKYPEPMAEKEMPYKEAVRKKLPVGHPWWTVLRDYSNADSGITVAIWKEQRQLLKDRKLEAIFAERMKLLPIAYRMEKKGVSLSKERLDQLTEDYREASDRSSRVCVNIAASYGYELKPSKGVTKNLQAFCFDVMGLEKIRNPKAKTSNPTLDSKNAIPHYLITLPPNSKELMFIRNLEGKRTRETAITYMEGYRKFWMPLYGDGASETDGTWFRLHPDYRPTGTDTLRWGCKYPNLQNVSKKEKFNLRYGFGPAPGREWWSLDAKNIEARLPAYESGEQELINLYEDADSPPYYGSAHLLNFHTVYPDIWAEELGSTCNNPKCCNGKIVDISRIGPHCKKKYAATWYQYVKNGGFAVQYGAVSKASGWGTADRAFHKQYAHSLLKQRFSKLEKLNQRWIRYANERGYVETIPDRSVDPSRGYPIMCTRTEGGYILETVPLNYHIQGSAMWWTARAMVRTQEQLDEWNRQLAASGGNVERDGYFMEIQVHDELVFNLPKRGHPKNDPRRSNLGRIRVLQRLMEKGGDDFGYPTPVGVEFNEVSWSEGLTF